MRTLLMVLMCALVLQSKVDAFQDVDLGTVTEKHQMIPMRDGKHLSAYVYFPEGQGPWPALFEQRYADISGAGTRKAAARLAEAGYVVAMVNYRGTHTSEGTWVGYRALGWGELKDGYDTCEWLGTQPWSTGKIGTFGSSQAGYAQNFLAVTQPPHLTAQYMVDTGLSLFHEGYRIGGTNRPARFKSLAGNCRNPEDNDRLLQEWLTHPNYDDYWKDEDCSLHFAKMNVPCFTIGSWYDFMNQGSIASFQGRQHHGGDNSRGKQQLIIGPWLHGRLNKGFKVAELTYPEDAAWPEHEHMIRWFDYWLKGKATGVDKEPAVRYYVMGAVGEDGAPGNVWRTADDFPPAANKVSMFLAADGMLTPKAPTNEAGSTSLISDPRHPMEIPGTSFPGAADASAFEKQAEVRTFTSPVIESPIEWTGRIRTELFMSSTALDTDVIVRVSDVYPDGRSILIVDYPQRLRYRDGFDHEVMLKPGEVVKVAFDVGWISQIFNKGHRIRVTVASTGAPLYEPNPQNGKPATIEFPEDAATATNTIYHNAKYQSRIIAPVAVSAEDKLIFNSRSRKEVEPGTNRWHSVTEPTEWKPSETCIVVCDMWDDHWCKQSAARVGEMAPRMNEVIKAARAKGMFIIHCPSDTMEFYKDTPQRKLAQAAPVVKTDVPLERWVYLDKTREGEKLPIDDSDGGCDCDPPVKNYRAWSRQHPAIEIADNDAITDSAEAFYLMKQRGIQNVIVMGVHTNMCVLGRPFSIRQMVRQGQNVVLMRDMTDTMYNPAKAPFVSHFTGNDLIAEHIEQYWCPTVTSTDLVGGEPFRFKDDQRKRLAILMSEPEYKTELSLTEFARTELGKDFKVSLVYGDAQDGSILPGLDVLKSADIALFSVRRRTLLPEQMTIVREFIAAGKPVVGIRTANHSFCLRDKPAPEGRTDWKEFDKEVIGGSYTNHHGAGPETTITVVEGAAVDAGILAGVNLKELIGKGSLYQVSPLQSSAKPLLIGTISDKPSEPIAWLNKRADGGTTFYTSLGHVGDFEQPAFRQLLKNACLVLSQSP